MGDPNRVTETSIDVGVKSDDQVGAPVARRRSSESSLLTRWLTYICLAAFLVTFAPLWWNYLTWTWRDGHYQYFPLLIAFVAFLYWSRREEVSQIQAEPKRLFALLAILATAAVALMAHLLASSFVAIIATICAAWAACYARHGLAGLRAIWPVLGLLFFAVPLPMNLDESLIFRMQFLASRLASRLLDGAGIMHIREGVILITEYSRYMTEEACSGVRSLFSSLAVVAVYSVTARHSWFRTASNLCQTIVWVLIGNTIRVAMTVVLADHVSTWFASGPGHELLSLFVFAFILAMVASTDQIILSLARTQYRLIWGNLDTLEIETRAIEQSSANSNTPKRPLVASLGRPALILITLSFLFTSLIGLRATTVRLSDSAGTPVSIPRLPALAENHLPPTLARWERVGFQHIHREGGNLFAEDSFTWKYRSGNAVVIISVDCPWATWHNLDLCYSAIGWQSDPTYFNSAPIDAEFSQLTFSELSLSKRGEERGVVLFTVVDRERRDVQSGIEGRLANASGILRSMLRQSAASLGMGIDRQFAIEGRALPATTIQLYSERSGQYDAETLEQIRELFFSARAELLRSPRWSS